MVKAKEFLEFICNDLEYRFFTGTPCLEFKSIYNNMDSRIMHYIPAVDENSAANIVSGSSITGIKSMIMMPANKIFNIIGLLNFFILKYNIPFLILSHGSKDQISLFNKVGIYSKFIDTDYRKYLRFVSNKSIRTGKPCGIVINGKELK